MMLVRTGAEVVMGKYRSDGPVLAPGSPGFLLSKGSAHQRCIVVWAPHQG